MPEIKNNFQAARMNKDLDERLVPPGEDATNIEISTSEGSDAGVAQSLLGNGQMSDMMIGAGLTVEYDLPAMATDEIATCVGVVAAPDRDCIYYFVKSDRDSDTNEPTPSTYNFRRKNYILEYNTVTERNRYVFVDIHYSRSTVLTSVEDSTTFHLGDPSTLTSGFGGVRTGMKLVTSGFAVGDSNYVEGHDILVTKVELDSTNNKVKVTVDKAVTLDANDYVAFKAESVLKFTNKIITGINILDNFLFWTDNESEPKKINITRSIKGTGGTTEVPNTSTCSGENALFHTRVVAENSEGINEIITNDAGGGIDYAEERHVTVIKKAPATTLGLKMYRTSYDRVHPITEVENPTIGHSSDGSAIFTDTDGPLAPGQVINNVNFDTPVDFRVGDVLLFAGSSGLLVELEESYSENNRDVRAKVVDPSPPTTAFLPQSDGYSLEILSIKEDVASSDGTYENPWVVRLEDRDPIFNFKFPRFSYRYKYTDNEYSPFAPWSEIAFLPGSFDYQPKKGHNLGMMNQMRGVKLCGYHGGFDTFPQDVVEIDILYKETNNPTVYCVKTIKKSDAHPLWPDGAQGGNPTGEFNLTTDLIYKVVPSNQLIRPFDNVPKRALAQEVSASRVIYGNYYQNFDIPNIPSMSLGISSTELESTSSYQFGALVDGRTLALPSVKTMRDYQIGVVFSDRYGRETPVLTTESTSIRVPKSLSGKRNKLEVQLTTLAPTWAEYYSFYIKEPTVEYYTMSMDRWYNAADGNIWLSFPSADRNKLMDEDFLILKKAHASDDVVYEKAKYRVIAIENDAPDFIKTRRISLGMIKNNVGGNAIAPDGVGFPLPNQRVVILDLTSFDKAFGRDIAERPVDNLFLRVLVPGNSSNYYEITNIAPYPIAGGGTIKLTVDRNFGDDMGMTSTDGLSTGVVDGLAVEITQDKVTNAPEFDGRFFVKIYKDDVLSEYVASVTPDDYYVTNAFGLGYINNHGYVNSGMRAAGMGAAPTGKPVGYDGVCPFNPVYASPITRIQNGDDNIEWTHYTGMSTQSHDSWAQHYTSWKYTHAKKHPTEHDWENGLATAATYNGSSYSTGAPYEWFQYHGDAWQDMRDNMDLCAIRSICGDTWVRDPEGYLTEDEGGQMSDASSNSLRGVMLNMLYGNDMPVTTLDFCKTAEKFWRHNNAKNRFFIDAATAYQLAPGVRDLPGNRFPSSNLAYGNGTTQAWHNNNPAGLATALHRSSYTWEGYINKYGAETGSSENPAFKGYGYEIGYASGFMAHGPSNFFDEGPYASYLPLSMGGYASNIRARGNNDVFELWNWENEMYVSYNNLNNPANAMEGATYDGAIPNEDFDSIMPGSNIGLYDNVEYEGNNITFAEAFNRYVKGEGDAKAGAGTPSRGVYELNGYSAMDVSWSSWDNNETQWSVGSGVSAGTVPIRLEDAALTSTLAEAAWEFIQALCVPGANFRFRRDPDGTIYTVKPFTQPYVTDGYDSDWFEVNTSVYDGTWGIRNYAAPNYNKLWSIENNGLYDGVPYQFGSLYSGGGGNPAAYAGTIGDAVSNSSCRQLYANSNLRQRWTILVEPQIGSGPSGYNPIHGTDPDYGPAIDDDNFRRALKHDNTGEADAIEILQAFATSPNNIYASNPAIWETEPRESVELDLYYQASRLIPTRLTKNTFPEYLPVGTKLVVTGWWPGVASQDTGLTSVNSYGERGIKVTGFTFPTTATPGNNSVAVQLASNLPYANNDSGMNLSGSVIQAGYQITFLLPDGSTSTLVALQNPGAGSNTLNVYGGGSGYSDTAYDLSTQKHCLSWNNCWAFGNGVESDRIRDDYNAPQMDNGVKVSATLEGDTLKEERRKYGLIWSGIYNSISGINETNQFIAGESITKDINPSHGSIQTLVNRNTQLIVFCEDKVLHGETNKDLLFNADGSSNLVASSKVVGSLSAYQGDYGISTNPESLAITPSSMYFTDVMRGKVLVLSSEGVRPISDIGMKDYFADYMASMSSGDMAIGTYDERKSEYNLTITKKASKHDWLPEECNTVSYSEKSKGWVSFKTFHIQKETSPPQFRHLENGISLNNNYYTFYSGHIWKHHTSVGFPHSDNTNVSFNNFYKRQHTSDITFIFNQSSEEVKSFGIINYEGSQARITAHDGDAVDGVLMYNNNSSTNSGTANVGAVVTNNVGDGEYYNLTSKTGWFMESLNTNLQSCGNVEFKNKEGKYYGYLTGVSTYHNSSTDTNLDEKEFSVQGLGIATVTHDAPSYGGPITITVANNESTTFQGTDGSGDVWDSTAD